MTLQNCPHGDKKHHEAKEAQRHFFTGTNNVSNASEPILLHHDLEVAKSAVCFANSFHNRRSFVFPKALLPKACQQSLKITGNSGPYYRCGTECTPTSLPVVPAWLTHKRAPRNNHLQYV